MHLVSIAYWTLGVRTAQMLVEANAVIAFRVLGMTGGWPVSPSENSRMVLEKGPAFIRAYGDATQAMMKGKRPDEIAEAALRPISRKTRSNAKRLSRRRR
jgi:hypothetical protein